MSTVTHWHHRPMACLFCGRENEDHAGAEGTRPEPDDWSMCWGCGEVGVFTDGGIRRPTPEERAEILADPEVQQARAAIGAAATPEQAAAVTWGSS